LSNCATLSAIVHIPATICSMDRLTSKVVQRPSQVSRRNVTLLCNRYHSTAFESGH